MSWAQCSMYLWESCLTYMITLQAYSDQIATSIGQIGDPFFSSRAVSLMQIPCFPWDVLFDFRIVRSHFNVKHFHHAEGTNEAGEITVAFFRLRYESSALARAVFELFDGSFELFNRPISRLFFWMSINHLNLNAYLPFFTSRHEL